MKTKRLAILVVITSVLFGCEVDQAVTGIRILNQTGGLITEVSIVPDGVTLDGAPNILSGSIPDGDSRDFETGAGVFDIRIQLGFEVDETYSDLEVTEGQVSTWTVLIPE